MKKILTFLLTLLLLVPVFAAAETRTNETTGFKAVLDDSGSLLDAAQYDGVWSAMMPITEHCNVGFYTYSGSDTGYVMNKAKAWANDNFQGTCTLFIIDMATRQLAVWSSPRLISLPTMCTNMPPGAITPVARKARSTR